MKICVPSPYPGGPDTPVTADFELADMLDYYEVSPDGSFSQIAQTRNCIGACIDPVEAIMRRGVKRVIVTAISPSYLMRFRNAGVMVLKASGQDVAHLLREAVTGQLEQIKK